MIGGQGQSIGDNSTAIQARGDVNINQGLTLKQMSEIMIKLQNLVKEFTDEAQITVQTRFEKFQNEMLEKFADNSKANAEAFKDPDYQFLLKNAQLNYARDGNDATCKILVELLAERSKIIIRNRISLVLNEATEKINKLTDEDLSILSLSFVLLYTGSGCGNYNSFIDYYNRVFSPFVKDLNFETSSFEYLESLGCLSLNPIFERNLDDIICALYGELFTDGFTVDEFKEAIQDVTKRNLAQNLLIIVDDDNNSRHFKFPGFGPLIFKSDKNDKNLPPEKYRFRALNKSDLSNIINKIDLSTNDRERLDNLVSSKHWTFDKRKEKIRSDISNYVKLETLWPILKFKSVSLTSVGIALGHANVTRSYPEFNAPLSIWIK